mmetsp:Transcript_23904/g.49365  ORF Transcript_23904/g.49365 Transcript_23904/m.49365 type:complete len:128 (+) Transcript_23904:1193-1576(+)
MGFLIAVTVCRLVRSVPSIPRRMLPSGFGALVKTPPAVRVAIAISLLLSPAAVAGARCCVCVIRSSSNSSTDLIGPGSTIIDLYRMQRYAALRSTGTSSITAIDYAKSDVIACHQIAGHRQINGADG